MTEANPEMPTAAARQPAWLRFAPLLLLCLLLTAADFHFVVTKLGGKGYSLSVQASEGVVNGLPHWRLYQSRVLGPYSVDLISRAFAIPYAGAQVLLALATLLLAKLAIVAHRRRDRTAGPTAFMLLTGSFLFALLVGRPWLYAWDFYGILLFTLFTIFALDQRPWTWFVPLVAVAFLNRESAVFMAAWMVMQGVLGGSAAGTPLGAKVDWRMLVAGLVTAAAGLAVVYLLRETLLVREVGPELFGGTAPAGTGWFHWKLPENLTALWESLRVGNLFMPWLFTLLPVGAIAVALGLAVRSYPRHSALCLCYVLLFAAILLFGVVVESRVMLETIPFFAVLLPELYLGRTAAAR